MDLLLVRALAEMMWGTLQRFGILPTGKTSKKDRERLKDRRRAFRQANKKEWGLIQMNKPTSLKPYYVAVDNTKSKE